MTLKIKPNPTITGENAEVNRICLNYTKGLSVFAVFVYPSWGLLDFFFAPELFFEFMTLRVAYSIVLIILVYVTRLSHYQLTILNYYMFLGMSIGIAYMCNVVKPGSTLVYFVGYSTMFIGTSLFMVWHPFHVFFLLFISIVVFFGFFFTVGTHSLLFIMGNGGLFCLTLAIAFSFLSMIRYNQIKREVRSRLLIAEANRKLKALDRTKNNFFANVSHELRTPLTLIMGPLEALLQKKDSNEPIYAVGADLESMHRNALRLLKQINNLLDISKIEAEKVQTTFRKLNIATHIKNYAASLYSAFSAKGIRFDVNIGPQDYYLYLDEEMLEKIIINILSNAYKFTNSGGRIAIDVWESGIHVYIKISDTGIGIPENKLLSIYDRFSQVDADANRKYEGTGIGLSLVKELMDIQKGNISVESKTGKGTVFTLCFLKGKAHLDGAFIDNTSDDAVRKIKPHHLVEFQNGRHTDETIAPAVTDQTIDKNDFTILIIEDNHDMMNHLISLFKDRYHIYSAYNGAEGLEKTKIVMPDLILSDVMMPRMDGFTLVEKLRQDQKFDSIPIILLTAKADIPDKIKGLRKGANDYIPKPFHAEELLSRVAGQMKLKKLRDDLAQEVARFKSKKKNVTEITRMKINKIKKYIEENYTDNLTREDLAEIVKISPDHLGRMFFRETKIKLIDLINELRVKEAARQITETDQQITRIALAVGFTNIKTFNTAFFKVTGQTPSKWRGKSLSVNSHFSTDEKS